MKDQPIFLVGASRSGTTLLRLMLNEHPEIAIPPESHFLIPLIRTFGPSQRLRAKERDHAAHLIVTHSRFQTWNVSSNSVRESLFAAGDCRLADVVDIVFRLQIASTGKRTWGDKTPEYTPYVRELAALFTKSRFIHIVRDGRDVSLSLRGVGWRGPTEYHRAKYWDETVRKAESAGADLGNGRYKRVMYRDLVVDPEKTLHSICDFLEMQFHASMLRFFENASNNIVQFEKEARIHDKLYRPSRRSDIDRWRREMSPWRRWAFEAVAGESLRTLGFEIGPESRNWRAASSGGVVYRFFGGILWSLVKVYRAIPATLRRRLMGVRAVRVLRRPFERI